MIRDKKLATGLTTISKIMNFNEDSKQLLVDYTNFISRNIDISKVNPDDKISDIIHYNDLNAVKQRISNWVSARLTARHAFVPDWTDLIRVYDYVIIDCHVTGIINGIKQKIKSKEWSIKDANGEINEELTKQLKTRWFSRYQDYFVEAMFFPYSLVELGDYKDGRFNDIQQIKREYVVPQWKSVKMYLGGAGVPRYNHHNPLMGTTLGQPRQELGNYMLLHFESEERINDYIFMQSPLHDLGLLDMASPHALGKMGSYTFFLDYLQKFVIPFRMGKTDINDNSRRGNMISMMDNWGASGYAVVDLMDEIELLSQSGSTTAPFTDLFTYSNNEISKAFASAVGIFDEKNFVGSAEAGERMLDYIVQSYCTEMEYNINDELLPRLAQRDSKFKGKEFDFASKEVIPFNERVEAVTKLAPHFELNPDEVGELVDLEIGKKEIEPIIEKVENEPIKEVKEIAKEEPKAIYPAEMVENAKRALKYLNIKKIELPGHLTASNIVENTPLGSIAINRIADASECHKSYTSDVKAVEFDLLGGKSGKEWAINQLKSK